MNVIKIGDKFKSTNKLGNTYNYEIVGVEIETGYTILKDLDDNSISSHENEWFKLRKIEILKG